MKCYSFSILWDRKNHHVKWRGKKDGKDCATVQKEESFKVSILILVKLDVRAEKSEKFSFPIKLLNLLLAYNFSFSFMKFSEFSHPFLWKEKWTSTTNDNVSNLKLRYSEMKWVKLEKLIGKRKKKIHK